MRVNACAAPPAIPFPYTRIGTRTRFLTVACRVPGRVALAWRKEWI